ncbi:hypothetical protein OQA88_239 [Cercophora sp. LCS_1]
MSADLFAAFEGTSQSSKPQQNHNAPQQFPSLATTNDPFSFLSSPAAAPAPQNSQPSPKWPSLQQHAASQQPAWNTWSGTQASQPQAQATGVWGDLSGLAGTQSSQAGQSASGFPDEDDDAWGDFEVATNDAPQPPPTVPRPNVEPPQVRTRVTRASTIDLMTNKLVDLNLEPKLEPWQEPPSWVKKAEAKAAATQAAATQAAVKVVPKLVQNHDPNVLFDADDFELQSDVVDEDDEFGDFETGVSTTQPQTSVPAPALSSALSDLDLLGLGKHAPPPKKQPPGLMLSAAALDNGLPYPQAPKSPYGSFQNRKPEAMKQLKVKTPLASEFPKETKKEASPTPVTAWPSIENDGFGDDWSGFKDTPTAKPKTNPSKPKQAAPQATQSTSDWDWDAWDTPSQQPAPSALPVTKSNPPPSSSSPPPTNIPPPSILLSIFPSLLPLATNSLFKPVSSLPAASQQRVLADASTVTFLKGYLALAAVAGRIIAGRKQRWHRDKFLMQSMSISAASSSKTRGMKLAGVDKTQAAREDREAAEVVTVWKQQVGRLRSAVASVNASKEADVTLRVPELETTMAVSAASGVPTAPKACVVCGLKREERVSKVDYEVEDSFGEWWVEFWGHRECRNWWVEYEARLRSK